MTQLIRFELSSTLRLALGLALIFMAEAAFTQEQQPSPEPPALEIIPAAEIPGRLEQTIEDLQSISTQLKPSAALIAIDSLLPPYVEKIRENAKTLTLEHVSSLTLRALADRQEEWERYASHLSLWRSSLESRAQQLEGIRTRLQAMEDVWKRTRSASREEELPAVLRQTIQTALTAISQQQSALQTRRTLVLRLLKKVTDEALEVADVLRRMEQGRAGFTGKLLEQDSPPLWSAFAVTEDQEKSVELYSVNQQKLSLLGEFVVEHQKALALHLLAGALVLGLLYSLRRKSTALITTTDGVRTRELPHVLRRPISTALIILFLIARISLPEAPTVFFRVVGFLMLIPLLRLLPQYIGPFYRRAVYVLSALYLLHRFEALSIDFQLSYRILLLILTIGGILALAWFERSVRHQKGDASIASKPWHRIFLWGAIVLLVVSLLANILGSVTLAEILTEGTLNSLYVLVALSAGVLIFGDVFDILLRTRLSQSLHMVRSAQELLTRQWGRILYLFAALAWTYLLLGNFNLWLPVRDIVTDLLRAEWTVGTWTLSLAGLVGLIVTLWISVLLSRFVRFALETDVLPRTAISRGVQSTISTMARYLVLLAGLVLATSMIGINWDTIAIIIGALGVGIGFGLQTLVNNFVSGLILMFERPINVGDTIEFGNRFGDVLKIGLRASTVRTFDGSEVIVPNANLVSSEVVNWTLSDRNRRMEIRVGVAYGTDPQKVIDILLRGVRDHPKVMTIPEPFAWFMGFGESSLDFVVKFWCLFEHAYTARSEIMTSINRALTEAGIVIPFPQRDLHVRSIDPDARESLGARKASDR